MDSSDKPKTDGSSDISASGILQSGHNKNNRPQPDISTSSDSCQTDPGDTPELSTSSPSVTTQTGNISLSVTTHNSDKPPGDLQPQSTIPPPMGYDDNVHSDTPEAIVMFSEMPLPVENIDITLSTPAALPTLPTSMVGHWCHKSLFYA